MGQQPLRSIFFLSVVVAVCAACATTANYEKVLNSWVGANADDLVRSWGVPASTYQMGNGNRLLIFDERSNSSWSTPIQVNQAPGTWVGSTYYPGQATVTGGQTYSTTHWCRTQFEAEPSGRIVRWGYEGNSCIATAPK